MTESGLFSISDFAKFSRTTRDALLHYDRIGLLSPASRADNKYRLYTGNQLAVVNAIRVLQQMGMTLQEIKGLKDRRTPEIFEEVLAQQIEKIDGKINDLIRTRKLLLTKLKTLHSAINVDQNAISIQFLPKEALVLGDLNDYSCGRTFFDTLLSFYQAMSEKFPEMDLNYQVSGFFSEERIKRGDWTDADRYYFNNPEGLDIRPAGLYAIGHMRGGVGDAEPLYQKLVGFIDKNGFEICGPAYEEYPLDEFSVVDINDYLIRVMITVREKQQ